MSKIPHPALRALVRGAGTAGRLAARFRDAGDGLVPFGWDLGSHPLLSDESIRTLVGDPDTASVLQRALERLARNPPSIRAAPRSRRARADAPGGQPVQGPVPHEPRAAPGAADDTDRVNAVLAEHDSTEVARRGSGRAPIVPRPRERLGAAKEATSEASATDRSRASDSLDRRARRAGAIGGLNRPVLADPVSEETTTDLLAHGRMSDEALRESANRIAGDEPVPGEIAVSTVAVLLKQVERRVLAIERRRIQGAADRREAARQPVASLPESPGFGFATEQSSGLRRLAMQAGAGVRRTMDDRSPGAAEPRTSPPDNRPGSDIPANDDDLSRRLADILRREAWRHGIDTSGVDP